MKKERGQKELLYKNKKKTNYIFITIIGMITIIIAINYVSHPSPIIIDIVDGLSPFPSPYIYYIHYVIIVLPYRNYNCHRYYGDWEIVLLYVHDALTAKRYISCSQFRDTYTFLANYTKKNEEIDASD